jgi:hypothetical protein
MANSNRHKKTEAERERTHDGAITFRISSADKNKFRELAEDNINPAKFVAGNILRLFVKAYISNPRKMELYLEKFRKHNFLDDEIPDKKKAI